MITFSSPEKAALNGNPVIDKTYLYQVKMFGKIEAWKAYRGTLRYPVTRNDSCKDK